MYTSGYNNQDYQVLANTATEFSFEAPNSIVPANTYTFQVEIAEETFSGDVIRNNLDFNIIVEDGGISASCEITPDSTSYSENDTYDFNDAEGKMIYPLFTRSAGCD